VLWISLWMICADSRPGAQLPANTGAGKYAMTPEEITALAVGRYTPDGCEGPDDCLSALLADVAGAYTRRQGSSLITGIGAAQTVRPQSGSHLGSVPDDTASAAGGDDDDDVFSTSPRAGILRRYLAGKARAQPSLA
jgi:hypothetical protein